MTALDLTQAQHASVTGSTFDSRTTITCTNYHGPDWHEGRAAYLAFLLKNAKHRNGQLDRAVLARIEQLVGRCK